MSLDQHLQEQFDEFEAARALLPAVRAHNDEMRRFNAFMNKRQMNTLAATDKDIVLFLIAKNRSAQTQYHSRTCPHVGKGTSGARVIANCALDHKCPHKSTRATL